MAGQAVLRALYSRAAAGLPPIEGLRVIADPGPPLALSCLARTAALRPLGPGTPTSIH